MRLEFVDNIDKITLGVTANVWVNIHGEHKAWDKDAWLKVNLGREKQPNFTDIKNAILCGFECEGIKFKSGTYLISDLSPEHGITSEFLQNAMGVRFQTERERELSM
ncbi:hypothetical protein [Vibrio owensii]|uniref:hypothetical protein n=1 Tax=Vibrio harveyi group TaxID=717610 RepID=UPI003CC5CDA5